MDRRALLLTAIAALGTRACASAPEGPSDIDGGSNGPPPPPGPNNGQGPNNGPGPSGEARTFSRDEMVGQVSDFMGVTAESAGAAIERLFRENGRPTGYIAGEEGSQIATVKPAGIRSRRQPARSGTRMSRPRFVAA